MILKTQGKRTIPMAQGKHGGALGAVYEAKGAEEVAALYDRWSETYDHEMAIAGYRHPSICLALLARHLPRGAAPLLDAGAGTGLIGEWLGIMGYPHVEALDISEACWPRRPKGAYKASTVRARRPAPFADGISPASSRPGSSPPAMWASKASTS